MDKPQLFIPERKSSKGRAPKRLKADIDSVRVNDYIENLNTSQWQKIDIRDSAKGVLKGLFHFKQVYVWDKKSGCVEKRLLVVSRRKTKKGEEIKFPLPTPAWLSIPSKALPTCRHNVSS